MENKIVNLLRAHIGKPIKNAPSPVANWLQGTLIQVDEGALVMRFEVRHEMTNPIGTLHGGAIALILDEVIGATVYTLHVPYFHVSVNLNIDFLNTAHEGDLLVAKSAVIRQGKTLVNVECSLYSADNKLIARGISNLVKTNKSKIT